MTNSSGLYAVPTPHIRSVIRRRKKEREIERDRGRNGRSEKTWKSKDQIQIKYDNSI